MLGGTDERRVALKRADENRRVLKRVECLAGIALVHRILPRLRAPIRTLVNHTARKHDDLGVQDIGKRAQAGAQCEAGVMDDLDRLFVASTAQVVYIAAYRRTAGVDSTEALIVHTANRGARSNRLKMARTTAGAGNASGSRALDMAHMTGGTVEALHHATVLDVRTADARANTQAQHGELALTDAPMGLAQGMGLHIAHHGNGKPQILAQARPQLNAGPTRHDLVGIGDSARLGVNDTGGANTDAKDLDIGVRFKSSLDRRLNTLEDRLAALLRLGGNLGFKDRMGHTAIGRILHNGSRNLGAADIDGANVLVLHVALLRRQNNYRKCAAKPTVAAR